LAKNVHAIISDLKQGLSDLQFQFEHLGSLFGGGERTAPQGRKSTARRRRARVARVARKAAIASAAPRKARKKPNLSPAVRAQRKLQGRYMARFKTLSKAKQIQVRKVRAAKGYVAALKLMG
jgi:1,2-phenylacetyl-CoA epoxidase PaaB subunit